MKHNIIKLVVFILVFIASLFLFGLLSNKENLELTSEMSTPSLPYIYIEYEGMSINYIQPHKEERDIIYQRDTITPIDENREISIRISETEKDLVSLKYEVRKISDARLIEEGSATLNEDGEGYYASLSIKDLIKVEQEYSLTLILEIEGDEKYYYYTKLLETQNTFLDEKIKFVKEFHNNTFDIEKSEEIKKYIESDRSKKNNNLNDVDINSSLDFVMWSGLKVVRKDEVVYRIYENSGQIATIGIEYLAEIEDDREEIIYYVEESYRVRATSNRVYLLDYNRSMQEVPDIERMQINNSGIDLGISSQDIELVENVNSDIIVFQSANSLFAYNRESNKISCLYNYIPSNSADVRNFMSDSRIKILNVDEAGNIRFLVYGYKTFGRREAQVGIQLYYYNSELNSIDEELYIPYEKSEEILVWNMDVLTYISKDNYLYFYLDNCIYEVDIAARDYSIVAGGLSENEYYTSESDMMIACEIKDDSGHTTEIMLMDLNSREIITIVADENEYINAYGFIENDLIYGMSRIEDGYKDTDGNMVYPNYMIRVQKESNEIVKSYKREGIYILDCEIYPNYINLKLVEKSEDGEEYIEIDDDQIIQNKVEIQKSTYLEIINDKILHNKVQIVMKKADDSVAQIRSIPKIVLYEGNRTMDIAQMTEDNNYYLYDNGKVLGVYAKLGNAILDADELKGNIINSAGDLVWERGNLLNKNQIMLIKEDKIVEADVKDISQCIDKILNYKGIQLDEEHHIMDFAGAKEMLSNNLKDDVILDLTGCDLEHILFYINKDLPAIAFIGDDKAVLLTGFNQSEVVVYDPSTGELTKHSKAEMAEKCMKNGNRFISYFPKDVEVSNW